LNGKEFFKIIESGYEEPVDWDSLQANKRGLKKKEEKNLMQWLYLTFKCILKRVYFLKFLLLE
jgi:hypothetical protein